VPQAQSIVRGQRLRAAAVYEGRVLGDGLSHALGARAQARVRSGRLQRFERVRTPPMLIFKAERP